MKKTLSMLAVLGILACTAGTANAAWSNSNWNPMNWFGRGCNKCQKVQPCNECPTGYATPCNPCEKKVIQPCNPCHKSNPCPVQQPCDPCNKLQNMTK